MRHLRRPLRGTRRTRRTRCAGVVLSATALTGSAVAGWSSPAGADPADPAAPHVVHLVMTNDGFRLPATLRGGWVTFRASTPDAIGHQLEGFRPRPDVTVAQVVDDIERAASPDLAVSADGTRAATRDADLVGGPAVDPITAVSVTVHLAPGRYYFFDFNDPFTPGQDIRLHEVRVRGRSSAVPPRAVDTIRAEMTAGGPRFAVTGNVRADGTIRVANRSGEIHELLMGKVHAATTDDQVAAYYASGSTAPPPYAAEPGCAASPRCLLAGVAYLRYDRLPAARYVLLCYAGDPETGVPHVYEGMHAVVRFRH